jgi:hypothetical protein
MLSQTIVLKDNAAADVTFATVGYPANGADRVDIASTTTSKGALTIRHSTQGKGDQLADRHLVQFSRTNSDLTGSGSVIVNLTITKSQNSLVDAADVYDALHEMLDLIATMGTATLDTSLIDQILRGES